MSTIPDTLNAEVLKRKLQTLGQVPGLRPEAVSRFGELLASLDDWSLFRLNPLRLARETDFDARELLEILLHSTRAGLFDLNWTILCPGCGSIEYTYPSINALKGQSMHCVSCFADVNFTLDEQVEVSFSLNPGIRDLSAVVDPLLNFDNYYRYYFSNNLIHSPEMMAQLQSQLRGFFTIEPGEYGSLTLSTQPDKNYRVINLQSHSQFWVKTQSEAADLPLVLDTDLGDKGFVESERQLPAGELTIRVHNCSGQARSLTLWEADIELIQSTCAAYPSRKEPYLTAKMLLNNQTFRELYRIQQLDPDLSLSIGNQTLLFTDLKGSTAMYDATGDYQAYSLVQRHFNLLTDSTRAHAGSVVKTIGDAIMASFSTPVDALLAALDMLRLIESLNRDHDHDIELGLKIGLHTGPVLAVNANERLDFFGQTVNVAARVQGLAEAGEIWLSDLAYQAGCQEVLAAAGFNCERQSAYLKGVSTPTLVWRCYRP